MRFCDSNVLSATRKGVPLIPALVAAAGLGALAPVASATTGALATSRYAVAVLPTLGAPFDATNAAGINDKGWIVGDANTAGSTSLANANEHATLWRNGAITDLGTLGGPNSSIGY